MKPKTYEEWLLTANEPSQLGVQALITHSLLRDAHKKVLHATFKVFEDAFERTLFEKGLKPKSIAFHAEEDCLLKAKAITGLIETTQGATLEQFAPVIYKQASDFYNEIKVWENKSLWDYIKWIIKRWRNK